MKLKIIHKDDLTMFVGNMITQLPVIAPVVREHQFVFTPVTQVSQVRLNYNTTILPPKKVFSPQAETLFTFTLGNGPAVQPMFDAQPRVLFGVHTCDIHALKLLDKAFGKDYRDTHYFKRRDHTLIIGIECLTPCDENSFCKSMGTLSSSDGYDLHLTDIGEEYAIDIGSTAGEELLTQYAHPRAATRDDIARLNRVLSEKWSHFTYKLDFAATELPALMGTSYKSRIWDELAEQCLGCSQCTVVCPTCYCFNVVDETSLDGNSGARKRMWDSCQLEEFALVATGENFRKTQSQRQRHRLFRKAKYMQETFGELGCVGCGRCARACLVHISPVTVFNSLHKAQTA
jgi:sulfhydrogenase subunit beta (sulfur reductase)